MLRIHLLNLKGIGEGLRQSPSLHPKLGGIKTFIPQRTLFRIGNRIGNLVTLIVKPVLRTCARGPGYLKGGWAEGGGTEGVGESAEN